MDVLEALFTSPPAHVSSSATKTLLFRSTSSSSLASHPQSINPPSTKPSLLTTSYHTHHQSHHVRIRYVITTPSPNSPSTSIHSSTDTLPPGEARDQYSQVENNDNKAELSHEILAGGASFMAMKMFEDRQRKEGKKHLPPSPHSSSPTTNQLTFTFFFPQASPSHTNSPKSSSRVSQAAKSIVSPRPREQITLIGKRPSIRLNVRPSSCMTRIMVGTISMIRVSRVLLVICRSTLVITTGKCPCCRCCIGKMREENRTGGVSLLCL